METPHRHSTRYRNILTSATFSENKVPFAAAVQTTADGKPQKVCFKAMRFTKAGIGEVGRQTLAPGIEVHSDALPSMKAGLAAEALHCHAIRTGRGREAVPPPEFRCVNAVPGNLKTAISGTCHAFNLRFPALLARGRCWVLE